MIPHNPLVRQLHDLDGASPQFHKQLSNILRGDKYQSVVPSLQNGDLVWLVEYLDSVLASIPDHATLAFQECLHELRKICGVKEVLPKSCTLLDTFLDVSFASVFGNVYEGSLGDSKVWVQPVGIYSKRDLQKVKTFYQVAVVWKHLAHPNIVPLLGITVDPLQLVSHWMSGRNLAEYISNNPDVDRLNLLFDIAEGLNYLHHCDIIHGDLKGSNVLVDTSGRARITGFGQDLDSARDVSDEHGHGGRWIAPEILDSRGTYSKEADVFSFAMVMIEAFAGAVPFSDKLPHAAASATIGGERPPRPTHPALTDALWTLIQRCWDQEAHRRPPVSQILRGLIPTWKRLIDRPLATDERICLITKIFSNRDETEAVMCLRGDDAQSFVNVVDEILDSLTSRLRKKCLKALCKICGRQALLPRSLQISLCYDRSENAVYSGGFADVWMGEHQGRKVAIKVLRVYSTSDLYKVINRFCKEVVTWKGLSHPNVLPLLGVTMSENRFAMVSEWMINGNINEFIRAHRDANRFELLKGVARGLIYIHGEGMVHGDLKGANILIDGYGHARLADFGLLTIVSDSTHSSSSKSGGTTQWMSPELIDPEHFGFKNGRPTMESDCYALGMVILEVLTGRAPFPRHTSVMVMRKVLFGDRPGRPRGAEAVLFSDDLWGMLEWCWSPQPRFRPTIEVVLQRLERGSTVWQPLPLDGDDDLEANSDDESDSTTTSYLAETKPSTTEARQRRLSPMEMSSTPPGPAYPPTERSTLPTQPSHELYPEQQQVDTPLTPSPRASHIISRPNGRGLSGQDESSKASLRPELRPFVDSAFGLIGNPPGTRPASPLREIGILPRSALQRGQDGSKKGAGVGSDWPRNKSNGGRSPPPRYLEGSPITDHLPRRGSSGLLDGGPPSSSAYGHTIGATIQDTPNGPTIPPRGVKRMPSPGPETPQVEGWVPIHTVAVPGDNVRMRMIAFSPCGNYFAVSCTDRSVRIWDTHMYTELEKLVHAQRVVSVAWIEDSSGVVSLGELGEISRWTSLPSGKWAWARILDASDIFRPGNRPTCFAYMKDRIAVAYPQMGVRVWLWVNGMWQKQRSILSFNVTNIRFVEGGNALFGGTSGFVLWYCQVPGGTLRLCSLFSAGIDYIDVSPSESELLVSLMDNTACVISINGSRPEIRAKLKLNEITAGVLEAHGGIYVNKGNSTLYGDTRKCMFKRGLDGTVVAGLVRAIKVQDQCRVEAVANYDFPDGHPYAGCIVMGTARGDLLWWLYRPNGEFESPTALHKRPRYD